ncbi:hypothetical protein Tsubulata_002441 [Turnera subulata]|uniref:Bifunctional inhibitor/plant lipid transfer protein/seed storage helical domain-containing protein n=1 Tax=Turnera subulata TaxID=218843 RepID=A0A9Q0FB32_9ROSI|nr:hypothetical protein Tsubulata_002441 [Turnera subulata]
MALKLAPVVLMCMFAGALAQDISCGELSANLSPCLFFVSYGAADPMGRTACCNALNSTLAQATTPVAVRGLCTCLVQAGIPTVLGTVVNAAVGSCDVALPFQIGRDTNCTSVQ